MAVEIITIQFLEVKACVNSSLKSFQKGYGNQSLIFEEIVMYLVDRQTTKNQIFREDQPFLSMFIKSKSFLCLVYSKRFQRQFICSCVEGIFVCFSARKSASRRFS